MNPLFPLFEVSSLETPNLKNPLSLVVPLPKANFCCSAGLESGAPKVNPEEVAGLSSIFSEVPKLNPDD